MYPVMMNIQNKPVVIIGGGKVEPARLRPYCQKGRRLL